MYDSEDIVPTVEKRWGYFLSSLLGALYFCIVFGVRILNPGYINWLLTRSDASMFYLGWAFFRQEPWSFPLGKIHGYLAPAGTSIGLTDSIPLLALPFKLIHSVLPGTFQYFGLWMLISYTLQGLFGYLLSTRFSKSIIIRLLISAFFITSPVMLHRAGGHIALGSHWLILAALWLFFKDFGGRSAHRELMYWCMLLFLSCFIHPYLTVMVLGIASCRILKAFFVEKRIRWWTVPALSIGCIVLVLGFWFITGTYVPGQSAAYLRSQFGYYSMNLNAMVNPLKIALFLKELPLATTGQYEGNNYLGLGIIFTGFVGFCLGFGKTSWRPSLRKNWPLLLGLTAFGLFALSNKVTFGESILFTIPLPESMNGIVGALRSSGRFLWPGYYLFFLVSLAMICRNLNNRIATAMLSLALVIQIADTSPLIAKKWKFLTYTSHSRMISPVWDEIASDFTHIATYPPMQTSTEFDGDFRHIGLFAAENKMTTSSGYAARISPDDVKSETQKMELLFKEGVPDPKSIYIIRSSYFPSVSLKMGARFNCTEIDGFKVCFPAGSGYASDDEGRLKEIDLSDFLNQTQKSLAIVMVKDEATAHLHPRWLKSLAEAGFNMKGLPYRGSYIGVVFEGKAMWQEMRSDSYVNVDFQKGSQLDGIIWKHDLQIRSAGHEFGNTASLKVDGKEILVPPCRGLNFVVFNESQDVEKIAYFDTHKGEMGIEMSSQ